MNLNHQQIPEINKSYVVNQLLCFYTILKLRGEI